MKFAFVITNLAAGGAEKALLKLGHTLAGRGHEVHMVLLEHRLAHGVPTGITLHSLTPPGAALSKGLFGKYLAAWRLRRRMQALAAPCPFDLIVSSLPFADEVALHARLPRHWCRIANTLSAEIERLRQSSPAKAHRRLRRYRRLYDGRALIAVSAGVAADLRESLALERARIAHVPNAFDFAAIRARARAPSARPAGPYLIHVGRFSGQKRHDLLLDAYARLACDQPLVLLTDPDPGLTRLINALAIGERVIVAGFQENPYPWIAGASLLVLSSDHEGLPNVILEALILGVPVVSTDCPSGPREILGAACPDSLVPVNDAGALAAAMARALARHAGAVPVDLTPYSADTVAATYERLAAEPEMTHS